jgi:hypothetical protein
LFYVRLLNINLKALKEELHNPSGNEKISVYANPKDGKLYINTLIPLASPRLEILDVTNQLVMSIIIEGDSEIIDFNDWNSGFYKLMIYSNGKLCLAKRIVKMHHRHHNYIR